jgi:hypothetical protein
MAKRSERTTAVPRIDDVPQFADEAEESAFWDTHYVTEEFWDSAPIPKDSIAQRSQRKTASVPSRPDDTAEPRRPIGESR